MQKLVPAALLSALCMVTSALAADMVGMKMDGQATKEGTNRLPTPIDPMRVEQASFHGRPPPVSASAICALPSGESQSAWALGFDSWFLASSMLHCIFWPPEKPSLILSV